MYESVCCHFVPIAIGIDRRESIEKARGLVLDTLVPHYSN
ncbi:MAG: hypothetical protein JWO09_1201 [Bacteroidetes bacterium]|nr:hypothetical protein [Bacteroidota bacterium]